MSKRLLHILSHKRLAFFTLLVVIVISCINGQLIQARIFWTVVLNQVPMALLKTEPKIQSDVDAGAVREMQPTEQIAIKINGHISNILSRPGQNFSIKDKAGLLRPYFPYFIRHAFQLPKYLKILIVLWFGTHLWDALVPFIAGFWEKKWFGREGPARRERWGFYCQTVPPQEGRGKTFWRIGQVFLRKRHLIPCPTKKVT